MCFRLRSQNHFSKVWTVCPIWFNITYYKIANKRLCKHITCKRCRLFNFTFKNISMLVFMQMRTWGIGGGGAPVWFLNSVSGWQPCWALHGDLPKFPNIAVNLWVLTSGQQDTERCPCSSPLGMAKKKKKKPWGRLKHVGFFCLILILASGLLPKTASPRRHHFS